MFFRYLKRKKWQILLFIVLTIVSSVFLAFLELAIPGFFESAQAGKYVLVVRDLGLFFVGIMMARLLEHYTNLLGIHLTNQIRREIKQDLFATVIYKQLPEFSEANPGEYIAEFTNDITIVETKFLIPLKEIVSYLIKIVTVCAAIYTIDYRMTLVILAGAVLCLALPVITTGYTSGRMIQFLSCFDQFVQRLKDFFGAFFTFKNYAVGDTVSEKFSAENARVEKMKFKAEFALVLMNNIVGRFAWFIELMVLVIGLWGMIQGKLEIGSILAAYLLAGQLGIPLQSLGGRICMTRSLKSLERKYKRMGMSEKTILKTPQAVASTPAIDVKLDNVSLRLNGRLILDDITMLFEHGKKYLIIGNNGSGKSTAAKILKNNYRSFTGSVTIGGYDLHSPEGLGLTRHFSYSNETIFLFSDSVRNNILLYRNVSETRLEEAVRMADLDVSLDRMVGDGGRFLSSGERRKLEIARALIENPKVMILDEVVSTLDIETAYEIEKLVLSLTDRTVIMISNAFSGQLLPQYDQIILMNNGKVLASGTHDELMKNSEEYRYIYQLRCESC